MIAEPLKTTADLWGNSWQAAELREYGWSLTIYSTGAPFEFDWRLRRGEEVIESQKAAPSRQKALRAAYNAVCDQKRWGKR